MNLVTAQQFDEKVIQAPKPVLVLFGSTVCTYCKIVRTILPQLQLEFSGIDFVEVTVDQNIDIAQQYNVRTLPTLILFKEGQVLGRVMGAVPKPMLRNLLLQAT